MKLSPGARRGGVRIGRLPMTSMIDVVFLLLIFFMVTADFAEPEDRLGAGLAAEGEGGVAVEDLQPQIVDVVRVNGRDLFRIGAREADSRATLESILADLPKDPGIVVRGSDSASVDAAAAALQAAVNAGFTKRSYLPAGGTP